MFGTIIVDAYEERDTQTLADAIEEICSPTDLTGWASAGIYSFWDYDTKGVLYIGLASDLKTRFLQHNGLIPIDDAACKNQEIKDYFTAHEKLGYSIFVQSPLSQPVVQRNSTQFRGLLDVPTRQPIGNYAGEEGIAQIKHAEGLLIEAYRIVNGDLPDWNKVGGDVSAREHAEIGHFHQIVENFSNQGVATILSSKSTIRELATNSAYEWFELQLHGLRMTMLTMGISFEESLQAQLDVNPWFRKEWHNLIDSGYMQKRLIV